MDIKNILNSGEVVRFHAVPGMTKQTTSQHQWGVAMLCHYFDPDCRKVVILEALTHDVAELITGDIPSTAKWEYPQIKEGLDKYEATIIENWGIQFGLTKQEHRLVKLCDALEGMICCIRKRRMGEIDAATVFGRWAHHVQDSFILSKPEEEIYFNLITEMGNVNGTK